MIDAGIIGEDEKFELIEGEIVMMASKGIAHERIKSALPIAVARTLPDDLTIGVATTLRLTDTTMLKPDIAVFPKGLFRKSSTGFARLDPGEARLVIEVAVSSFVYDKGLKAKLYARHRVQEFWVIDANEGITYVHTGASGDGWSSIVKYGPRDALTTPTLPVFRSRSTPSIESLAPGSAANGGPEAHGPTRIRCRSLVSPPNRRARAGEGLTSTPQRQIALNHKMY